MSNLFAAMRSSSAALQALQAASTVSQNNISNALTPGYAKQRLQFQAMESGGGLSGGVTGQIIVSSRDEFVESFVRKQTTQLGAAEESAIHMGLLESSFSLDDSTGITANLNKFFTAANSWTVSPSSTASKENVIAAAADVAASFNDIADQIQRASQNAEVRLRTTMTDIASIAERIRRLNVDIRNGGASNAGTDAAMHADLEELSSLVQADVVWQDDGTASVLIGGQTPLVVGDNAFQFTIAQDPTPAPSSLAGAKPKLQILDSSGNDVTEGMLAGGSIAGMLKFRNETVIAYTGGVSGAGDLNRLAKAFATRVNSIMTDGAPSAPAMFTWSSDVSAAQSLKVNPGLTPSTISAADPSTTPAAVNGRALKLAGLAHPESSTDMIDNISYVSFMGQVSASIGRTSAEATSAADSHRQMLAQAQTMREQLSGVSLDEEAVTLVQTQRAYEAAARIVQILDEMLQLAVNIGRS